MGEAKTKISIRITEGRMVYVGFVGKKIFHIGHTLHLKEPSILVRSSVSLQADEFLLM